MKILIWNVRGARKPSFRSSFGRLMQIYNFDICILLETRLSGDGLVWFRRQMIRQWSMHAVEANGLSGGIIVIWRPSAVKVDVSHQSNQFVGLDVSESHGDPWCLLAVYASTNFRERRQLWSDLQSILGQGGPSIVAGDFNCITEASEKRGGRSVTGSADIIEFRDFISSAGLLDLGFSGPRFTWCNNRQGSARVWERLDRVMATDRWLQKFSAATVTHLPRIASDHCPVLISTEAGLRYQRQFRFEQFWTSYSAARSIISQVWHTPIRGNAIYRLSRRLLLAKRRLVRWNRTEVGNIVRQVEQLEADISSLQLKEDQEGSLSDSDITALRAKLALHHSLLTQQETYWRQRSRVQWIREGDRNTRFFHQVTLKRRAANRIRRLADETGYYHEDLPSIRDQLLQFFKDRWSHSSGSGTPVGRVPDSRKVTPLENGMLIRPVSDTEIRDALWELGQDKAPGPDGFPPFFFRQYWDIVGQEVTQAIQIALHTKIIPTDWNRTLITLVPKCSNASLPQHYRPISLCTTLYKVCARVIAGRLSLVIPHLIALEQGAFIRGRSISDNVIIAQEFMYDLQRAPARQCLMAVKLDMERAYDRLSWSFLRCSLIEFGFDDQFIEWIMACIQRPSFSLIINGTMTEFFHSSVGLRQGCPLSPLLFTLAVDDLSRALYQAQADSRIVPFMATTRGPVISHLLFADDCILLGRATTANASSFADVIQHYCQASGQKVNGSKSSICFSPKTSRVTREAISCALGISSQADRLQYLGVPMTGRSPRCADYTELVSRIRQRIEGWQVTGLSMMARITIIRSVLTSLPMYLLSNAVIPISCLRKIERCFRDFLWASMQDGHGIHLMSWDRVCTPIQEGGLGIQSLLTRRETFLAKHASRFILEPGSLWSSFMRARYGGWTSFPHMQPLRQFSPFWKEVCRYSSSILENTTWMIGDGSSINAVQDSWIADISLSRWPSLYSTDIPSSLLVKDLISADTSSWDIPMVTRLFGDELSRRILTIPIMPGSTGDYRLWRRSCIPKAPSKDLTQMFRSLPLGTRDAGWIWKLPIIPRVQLFIWKLLWECLPTCGMLVSRGMHIQAMCPICGRGEESTAHAIFACPRVSRIWQYAGFQPRLDLLESQCSYFLEALRKTSPYRCALWASTAYQIWLSRNQIIFTDASLSIHSIVWKIRSLVSDCARGFYSGDIDYSGLWDSPAASAANRHTVFISWEPPPPGFVKINFDGSVRGRLAGSAYVIRGPGGNLIAAGGCGSLDSSVTMAELYAAWLGIYCAVRALQLHDIIIEGDSMTIIRWIRQDSFSQAPANPILQDIWATLREAHCVHICHTYREANSAADWVASKVAHHSGFWKWSQDAPSSVIFQQILYSDTLGLTRTRRV